LNKPGYYFSIHLANIYPRAPFRRLKA